MVNKLTNYLIWITAIVFVLAVIWLLVEPIIWWTPKSELRLYIRIFLLLFAVQTFAVLRLYNSIVQNTRFSIKLREVFGKFLMSIPLLERSMKNLNNSLNNVRSSIEGVKKELSDNTDSIQEFSKRIKR